VKLDDIILMVFIASSQLLMLVAIAALITGWPLGRKRGVSGPPGPLARGIERDGRKL
jgi:hypothetical protein